MGYADLEKDDNGYLANVTDWTEWGQYGEGIALQEFVDKTPGLNLANVDAISIGFGVKGSNQPAGGGMMFFDDIRLYGGRCVPQLAKPAARITLAHMAATEPLPLVPAMWIVG